MFGWSKRARNIAPADEATERSVALVSAPNNVEAAPADATLLSAASARSDAAETQAEDDKSCLARTRVLRLFTYLLLTLFENVYTLYIFDNDKYSELLIFATSIAQPVLMSTFNALSRLTDTGGDDLLAAVASETTQTALFIMFCDFKPEPTAVLLVPYALQLLLAVVEIRFKFPQQSTISEVGYVLTRFVGSVRGACGSFESMRETLGMLDKKWRAEQQLLGFGALVALLPVLCKEPSSGTSFTDWALADHFIRFVTGPRFAVATVVMLWALTVLAEDIDLQAAGVTQTSPLWSRLLLCTNYFALAYALFLGIGALMSTIYFLGPMLLLILPIAIPTFLIVSAVACVACVSFAISEFSRAFGRSCGCRIAQGPSFWHFFNQTDGTGGRPHVSSMLTLLAIVVVVVIHAFGGIISNFFYGCGGLTFFWAVLNITFAVGRVSAVLDAHGSSVDKIVRFGTSADNAGGKYSA